MIFRNGNESNRETVLLRHFKLEGFRVLEIEFKIRKKYTLLDFADLVGFIEGKHARLHLIRGLVNRIDVVVLCTKH